MFTWKVNDSGAVETQLILGSYAIVVHTQTAVDRLLQLSFRWAVSMSMPGNASLVWLSPADEFTARDDDGTIELHPVVLDGGVLWSKAAGGCFPFVAVNFSLYDRVTDVFIELYLELLCLMYLIQAGLGWLDPRPIPQIYAICVQVLDIVSSLWFLTSIISHRESILKVFFPSKWRR